MGSAFDPAKDASNIADHGISLARAKEMVIARFMIDDRFDYGETRYRAWAISMALPIISPSPFATARYARSAFAAPTPRR
jgi:uncharacterized DUF497 family protein